MSVAKDRLSDCLLWLACMAVFFTFVDECTSRFGFPAFVSPAAFHARVVTLTVPMAVTTMFELTQ